MPLNIASVSGFACRPFWGRDIPWKQPVPHLFSRVLYLFAPFAGHPSSFPFLGTFLPFSAPPKVLCSVEHGAQHRAWKGAVSGCLPEICVKKGQVLTEWPFLWVGLSSKSWFCLSFNVWFRWTSRTHPSRDAMVFRSKDGEKNVKNCYKHDSRTAKLRIWTLRIWCFSGPRFRIPFCETGALWGRVTPFFDHFPKHLSSVLGRTELCHEVRNPAPQKLKSSATKTTTWHCSNDVLEPSRQVLLASRDVIISSQNFGSKWPRVFYIRWWMLADQGEPEPKETDRSNTWAQWASS